MMLYCGKANVVNCNDEQIMQDIEGNVYRTVKIGNQIWMAENLRTTRYADGSAIPNVAESNAWIDLATPGYCCYNNTKNTDTVRKYGVLYNWHVIETKKLAPKGWHVPTETEWKIFQNHLIDNGYNWDGTTSADKTAQSISAKTDWKSSTVPGAPGNDLAKNNKSGFSALPGGHRSCCGYFDLMGKQGRFWSATEDNPMDALSRSLYFSDEHVDSDLELKTHGFSIRLLKD